MPFTFATPPGQSAGSLVLPSPKATPETADSDIDGARNPLPQVPRSVTMSTGLYLTPNFGVAEPP